MINAKPFLQRFKRRLVLFTASLLGLVTPSVHAVAVGAIAPDCALSSLVDQQSSHLNQYKGKVVYVDFWASWCGPCAKSFPFLNKLHQQFKDQGLQIIGVNLDENLDEAKTFLSKIPAEFAISVDVSKQCAEAFAVEAMPSSYIIDRKGLVHHIHLGFREGAAEELQTTIEQLLKAK